MPPKKAPSSLASQKTLLPSAAAAAVSSGRQPLSPPALPASDSLAPLWTPSSRPRKLFPEWPSATALAAESWCTPEAPFDDPLPLSELLLPCEEPSAIAWKRPSQFLPAIIEPIHSVQNALPVVPEPKAPPAKKGGAAASAAAPAGAKKGAAEPEAAKKAPLKHAHVFYCDPHDSDHGAEQKRGVGAVVPAATPAPAAQVGHASAGHATTAAASHASHQSHPHGNAPAAGVHLPPLSAQQAGGASDHHHYHLQHQNQARHHIPRDFRRLWSADELEEIAKWRLEEARIQREQEARERVYMGFEDAIAYIVNERPRGFEQEEDVDAEDLVDDDEDDDDDDASASGDAISNDSSPWGVLPPSRIEIAPNAICRPEYPHGDVVHGEMASLFRIVEQLFDPWTQAHESSATATLASSDPPAFLWRLIYPQDASGTPIYNPGGKYSVKLFVFGKWRRVDIDDKLPVDAESNIVYLTSSMRSEIWPALLTKALLKVVHWLQPSSSKVRQSPGGIEQKCDAMRIATGVLSALTGWKLSRWQPAFAEKNASESALQRLLEFVPSAHAPDESSEASADSGEQLLEVDAEPGASSPSSPNGATKQPDAMKPRAVICCGSATGTAALCSGEVALVIDIVGDTENTVVKFAGLKGSSSVPEETIAADGLAFLLIHPPFKHSDLHAQHWTAIKNEAAVIATAGDDASHALLWTPFANPTTQFALVKVPKRHGNEEQAAGDSSSESSSDTPTDHHHYHHHHDPPPIEVVFTLTRIPSVDPTASTRDARLRSAREIAKHIPEMDPDGSLVLIQEDVVGNARTKPMVVTLNTATSTRVLLPSIPDGGDHVFRVFPQQSLCYGYALQIESDAKVDFQEPSTYWRNVCDVQVVNSDGAYPVMLPSTWNVLFKHNVELTVPPPAVAMTTSPESEQQQHVDLYVDLHLSDAMLGQYVHISIIDDATSEVTRLSSLCSMVSLPVNDLPTTAATTHSHAFTIVVTCAPQSFSVPEGKWHLTLGSTWLFKGSSSHPMKLTAFEGTYEANKPLLCFRDVISAPKKSIWTSFELKLSTSDDDGNGGDSLSENLAVKLEVIDATSEQLLGESYALKAVRLLQLPRRLPIGGDQATDDDKSGGYIVQGSIDRSRCVVPTELYSVRPFRNRVGAPPKQPIAVKEGESGDGGVGGDDGAEAAEIQTSFPSARAPSYIKWCLNCWSSEEVKLDVDRTKELKFEAIRASWAEAAKDRSALTNGAVSRLLYLGKMDAAEVKMKHDGVSDELAKKLRTRVEWVESAAAKMNDGVYLERGVRGNGGAERMKAAADFEEEAQVLTEEIAATQSQLAQKREDRLAAREQRAQEVRDLVQSIREQRSAALKKRQKLWQQRDAVLAGSSSSSMPSGA